MTHRLYAVTLLTVLAFGVLSQAQTFKTLYTFSGGSDGGSPWAGLIRDSAGNLYGTANLGGDGNCIEAEQIVNGCGVVFRLNTSGKETVLHTFEGQPNDGVELQMPLVRDAKGNLYGTTFEGGSGNYGTVFKINTAGKETVLHNFPSTASDGVNPFQGLLLDKAGNLYGTTSAGGDRGGGTIFKINSAGHFTVLYSFTRSHSHGALAEYGHLMMDSDGNLFGTTSWGGTYHQGVLYQLSKQNKFSALHSFAGGIDGCFPAGTVAQDTAGNLYGTTLYCGSTSNGVIWRVSKTGKETILHNFAGGTSDGCDPWAGVTPDSEGNLYGVTTGCGAAGYGALYELSTKGKLTLLHSFAGNEGNAPFGEVLRTAKGELFGTALGGGTGSCNEEGCGTVWSYVP